MRYAYYHCLFVLFLLTIIGACSDRGPQTHVVSGTVTLDGQPVEKGSIVFDPIDGQGAGVSGAITDGKYSFRSVAGEMRVDIRATRATGRTDELGGVEQEEIIPERYNLKSELVAQVDSGGANVFDYDLLSN